MLPSPFCNLLISDDLFLRRSEPPHLIIKYEAQKSKKAPKLHMFYANFFRKRASISLRHQKNHSKKVHSPHTNFWTWFSLWILNSFLVFLLFHLFQYHNSTGKLNTLSLCGQAWSPTHLIFTGDYLWFLSLTRCSLNMFSIICIC